MLPITERFLRYTRINTTANPANIGICVPSSMGQHTLADLLCSELREFGLEPIKLPNATVIATLPTNQTGHVPTVAWIAHLDTHHDKSTDTKAQVVPYRGGDIVMNADENIVMHAANFPELTQYIGDNLIITDGTSLLGADNKSAIAEIMQAVEYLLAHPEIPRANMRIIFVPDEEIGLVGASELPIEHLNFDYGYTLDCCEIGELVVENWNAAEIRLTFKGQTAHPMSAKGKMKNAILIAQQFTDMLPAGERPEYTEKKEGYYWVRQFNGKVDSATIILDIRDFTEAGYQARLQYIEKLVSFFNTDVAEPVVEISIRPLYKNVATVLEKFPHVTETAVQAMTNLNIPINFKPMRGGFDGAALVKHNIPVANLFCGAHHFHSIYEFLPEKSLQKASEMVVEIMRLSVQQ